MHLNSCPERLTPSSRTVFELASTRWLPTTRSESPADEAAGPGIGVGATWDNGVASGGGIAAATGAAPSVGLASGAEPASTAGSTAVGEATLIDGAATGATAGAIARPMGEAASPVPESTLEAGAP